MPNARPQQECPDVQLAVQDPLREDALAPLQAPVPRLKWRLLLLLLLLLLRCLNAAVPLGGGRRGAGCI